MGRMLLWVLLLCYLCYLGTYSLVSNKIADISDYNFFFFFYNKKLADRQSRISIQNTCSYGNSATSSMAQVASVFPLQCPQHFLLLESGCIFKNHVYIQQEKRRVGASFVSPICQEDNHFPRSSAMNGLDAHQQHCFYSHSCSNPREAGNARKKALHNFSCFRSERGKKGGAGNRC